MVSRRCTVRACSSEIDLEEALELRVDELLDVAAG